MGISKNRTYPIVGAQKNTPTRCHRRWRIQIYFLNPRTYPVRGSHRYFEESHVPDCRGVSNTPHPAAPKGMKTGWFFEGPHVPDCRDVLHTPHRRPRRGRKRDSFSKNHAYPVGALHQYFEGSHVSSRRGVLNTPTKRHRRWRIQIHFLNPHTYPVVGVYAIRPTSGPEGDENGTSFTTVGGV